MSDVQNPSEKKTISVERKTLSVKRVGMDQSVIRQNFSHGRSNAVVVEKKKRRVGMPGQSQGDARAEDSATAPAGDDTRKIVLSPRKKINAPNASAGEGAGKARSAKSVSGAASARRLTEDEANARNLALKEAREREIQEHQERQEQEIEERRKAEEAAARKQAEALAASENKKASDAASAAAAKPAAPTTAAEQAARKHSRPGEKANEAAGEQLDSRALIQAEAMGATEEGDGRRSRNLRKTKTAARTSGRVTDEKRRPKLNVNSAALESDEGRVRSLSALRRRREKERRGEQKTVHEKVVREVTIPEAITIQELANRMAERAVDVIKLLMKQGQMFKINDIIDADTAQLVAEELGHIVKRVAESDVEIGLFEQKDDPAKMKTRAPVVTIMGHVDHGKTSLLDAVRRTKVVDSESGGITQHIGAYQVEFDDKKVTFIDTPGHAAFSKMRARGAKVTDIVVLVVAADDSVMPQTREAIAHARAADVPIIVAINKMDKEGADATRVRSELLRDGIIVEAVGGEVIDVEVSALKGENLDKLLEMILLQAELLELKADPDRWAEGIIIEAELDRGRGPVATVLVQKGTLQTGNIVVAGSQWGRVRAMLDEDAVQVKTAIPSQPVAVLGFQGTPSAGDQMAVVESEARAREIVEYRQRLLREQSAVRPTTSTASLDQMLNRLHDESRKEIPIMVKADAQGSVEAIAGATDALGNDEVAAHLVMGGVGGITESDVTLATASKAIILGFNVRANQQAKISADKEGIEIRYYSVIYDLINDLKSALSGMLAPERRETILGNASILEIFSISKVGKVAGCRVNDGVVARGAKVRLIRDDVVIHEGNLDTLRRFKDDAKEVQAGQECGMNFKAYSDLRPGDMIECFRVEEIARSL